MTVFKYSITIIGFTLILMSVAFFRKCNKDDMVEIKASTLQFITVMITVMAGYLFVAKGV